MLVVDETNEELGIIFSYQKQEPLVNYQQIAFSELFMQAVKDLRASGFGQPQFIKQIRQLNVAHQK